jgi:hypothetical protein
MSWSIVNKDPSNNAVTGRRTTLSAVLVRAAWFCILLFCVAGLLIYAACLSFPRAGASEPHVGVAAFNESASIFIMRVAHGPFRCLDRFIARTILELLILVFWTTVLYMLSALLHRPRWAFRPSSSTQ